MSFDVLNDKFATGLLGLVPVRLFTATLSAMGARMICHCHAAVGAVFEFSYFTR